MNTGAWLLGGGHRGTERAERARTTNLELVSMPGPCERLGDYVITRARRLSTRLSTGGDTTGSAMGSCAALGGAGSGQHDKATGVFQFQRQNDYVINAAAGGRFGSGSSGLLLYYGNILCIFDYSFDYGRPSPVGPNSTRRSLLGRGSGGR